jgi:hypothetical protein
MSHTKELGNGQCCHSMVENLCGLCIRDARITELLDAIAEWENFPSSENGFRLIELKDKYK